MLPLSCSTVVAVVVVVVVVAVGDGGDGGGAAAAVTGVASYIRTFCSVVGLIASLL